MITNRRIIVILNANQLKVSSTINLKSFINQINDASTKNHNFMHSVSKTKPISGKT